MCTLKKKIWIPFQVSSHNAERFAIVEHDFSLCWCNFFYSSQLSDFLRWKIPFNFFSSLLIRPMIRRARSETETFSRIQIDNDREMYRRTFVARPTFLVIIISVLVLLAVETFISPTLDERFSLFWVIWRFGNSNERKYFFTRYDEHERKMVFSFRGDDSQCHTI